jgi:hypothetical protein
MTDLATGEFHEKSREASRSRSYSTYLNFGNARENLMEKGVFLGVPKNPIFVGTRRICFWP